ncbi:MAG TPA: YigZ family protein [Clostridiales bacterium]|nr:YigZ family protein [Clostridiales bacterium]
MVESYKTIYRGCSGEIVMKKSRFIANILPVETEEEAGEFIDEIKKKYWDARHNCTAYIIGTENPIMHCSDDGEPSKTAGRPMLDVLLNHGLTNLVVVVTRYFGGTLLGTGGLVKAYQSATIEGLNQANIITKTLGYKMEISTDYNFVGKIQYYIAGENIPTLSSEYTDIVKLTIIIPISLKDELEKKIAEITNGQAVLEKIDTMYYSIINNKIEVYPN